MDRSDEGNFKLAVISLAAGTACTAPTRFLPVDRDGGGDGGTQDLGTDADASSSDVAGPIQFCDQSIATVTRRLVECIGGEESYYRAVLAENLEYCRALIDGVLRGSMAFDAAAAERCLEEYGALSCAHASRLFQSPECWSVFRGTREIGEDCAAAECKLGSLCDDGLLLAEPGRLEAALGTCSRKCIATSFANEGSTCHIYSYDCMDGYVCRTATGRAKTARLRSMSRDEIAVHWVIDVSEGAVLNQPESVSRARRQFRARSLRIVDLAKHAPYFQLLVKVVIVSIYAPICRIAQKRGWDQVCVNPGNLLDKRAAWRMNVLHECVATMCAQMLARETPQRNLWWLSSDSDSRH